MDYKEILRAYKLDKQWEKLLEGALKLYEEGKDERYVVRMIALAYENLEQVEKAIPFWEILGNGENNPEEYSRKLIDYYKEIEDKNNWTKWMKKLLFQFLRKKDFEGIEDIWMQMLDAGVLDKVFALRVAGRLAEIDENERAFTLLDLFLMVVEENRLSFSDAIDIARRMLDIDKNNVALRRKLISYYKHIYSNCDMIDDILEKANILRTDDIDKAIELLGRLMNLCPGKYVYHKTWGVGKIQSIDILFNKVFIDFPSYSGHAMSFDMAFDVLTPLEEDDFLVVKREKRDLLLTLKSENPAAIIKLMLNKKEELYENEVRKMLTDIIKDNEWKSFIEGVKKTAKSEGFQVKRKGNRYVFSILTHETKKELTIEEIEGISDIKKRLKALVSFTKQKLTEEERKQWIGIIENTIKDKEIHLEDKVEILFIKYDYTKDKEELDKRLSVLLEGKDLDAKQKIINSLSQKRYKKELFYFVVSEDEMFAEEVFLKTSDDWLRGYAEKILQEKNGLSNIWMKILQNPHQYSSSLLYLIDHAMKKGKKIEFAKRSVILFESLINLMSTENTGQKVRSKAKAIFLKYGFDLFRTLLETASQEEVKILLDIVKKSAIIDSGDKRAFESLANARYPGLKEKDDGGVFYVTKAAIKKKEKELDHLLKVEIPANSEAIGKAARQGDLSENFDYISAKEKQRKLIDRVNILKAELSKARPIEEVPYIEGEVGIGTRVVIEDVKGGEKREIVILGPWDSIPGKEVISHTAPFAGEVIGKKAGETFFDTYRKKNYRIASVEKCNY